MYTHGLVEYLGTSLLIGAVAFTTNPLFVVAALAIAIGLGGKISGGHFNPAITAWAFLSGKVSQSRAVEHLVAQLAAALTIWGAHSMIKV
jgi:aquaporin Z